MGAGEILRIPLKGVYISRMMKIADDTASALRASVAMTVTLGGANRPKLAKIAASHKIKTTNSGIGIGFCSDFRKSSHWAFCNAMTMEEAWLLALASRSQFWGPGCLAWPDAIETKLHQLPKLGANFPCFRAISCQ